MSPVKAARSKPRFVASCQGEILFISKKNVQKHKGAVIKYLSDQEGLSTSTATKYSLDLQNQLFCFVPLSTYEIKDLLVKGRVWLQRWQGQAYPSNQLPAVFRPGVWLSAAQLPAFAYLQTSERAAEGFPELTRLTEAGWHLAYYSLALCCAKRWGIGGPAGWLTLGDESTETVVFLPESGCQFLRRWTAKHRKACAVHGFYC